MYYIILFSFLGMIGAVLASTSSHVPGVRLNKKQINIILDILVCYIAGFIFVILEHLFLSGSSGRSSLMFDIDIFRARYWRIGSSNFENFIFASIITYLIIWMKKKYRDL